MSAKHTPGPWVADVGWSSISVRQAGTGLFVAKAALIDKSFPADDQTAQANARLIASAPDLLEALHAIAAIEDRMHGGDWEEIELAREIVRAAIAKATGGDA